MLLKNTIIQVVISCAKKAAHLFQRTKNTAATTPTVDRQNADTSDTASTVLRFSLFSTRPALPA